MESSALVYIGLTIVTVVLALFVKNSEYVPAYVSGSYAGCDRQRARNFVAEAAVYLLLAGVSACRIAVGNDYWPYRFNFRLIAQERYVSSEFGFNIIVKGMQKLFGYDNYLPIFALFSFVTVLFFSLALHAQAGDYAFSLFLLMTGGYYFNSLNSVRYYLALAIALYSMKYVIRGEYGKFVLWIIFGSAFHKSIFLVIPVYLAAKWLASVKLKKWHYAVGAVFIIAVITMGQNILRQIIFYFYPYYKDSAFDNGQISYVNIAKCLAVIALYVVCSLLKRWGNNGIGNYTENQTSGQTPTHKDKFYLYLNVAGLVAYCCGSFVPEISRVGYYMIISQIFLIPDIIGEIECTWFKRFCKAGVIAAFTVYFAVLLKGMYAVDVRLLPYLNWIFN
jgi:hypothetical protein